MEEMCSSVELPITAPHRRLELVPRLHYLEDVSKFECIIKAVPWQIASMIPRADPFGSMTHLTREVDKPTTG